MLFFCLAPVLAYGQSRDADAHAEKRRRMVTEQLAGRDISDPRVLEAMRKVPRHLFVLPGSRDQAYEDYPLPIEEGQTISQPYIVALMTQCLGLRQGEKVLEVGTGSGYQAAVLAEMGARVFSIEINERLAAQAARTLHALGTDQVQVRAGDGYRGWPEEAPFDAVIVTCAAPEIPSPLMDQLGEGGRLIIPLGSARHFQTLTLITKEGGRLRKKEISGVRFVPMTGEVLKKKDR
ncbi:MAG: protein-L-isoaspartate(D-aspartate) O-methyltransferase [Candidatus Aminicenantes bacterium]|nr:protein-L-isoaspartate(D-aspartate) O-methyltransferase [Candidatus Aminicenantes bacterium]